VRILTAYWSSIFFRLGYHFIHTETQWIPSANTGIPFVPDSAAFVMRT